MKLGYHTTIILGIYSAVLLIISERTLITNILFISLILVLSLYMINTYILKSDGRKLGYTFDSLIKYMDQIVSNYEEDKLITLFSFDKNKVEEGYLKSIFDISSDLIKFNYIKDKDKIIMTCTISYRKSVIDLTSELIQLKKIIMKSSDRMNKLYNEFNY